MRHAGSTEDESKRSSIVAASHRSRRFSLLPAPRGAPMNTYAKLAVRVLRASNFRNAVRGRCEAAGHRARRVLVVPPTYRIRPDEPCYSPFTPLARIPPQAGSAERDVDGFRKQAAQGGAGEAGTLLSASLYSPPHSGLRLGSRCS